MNLLLFGLVGCRLRVLTARCGTLSLPGLFHECHSNISSNFILVVWFWLGIFSAIPAGQVSRHCDLQER